MIVYRDFVNKKPLSLKIAEKMHVHTRQQTQGWMVLKFPSEHFTKKYEILFLGNVHIVYVPT